VVKTRDYPLDALRGFSLLAVCLFHSSVLPGGWLGVDIFFVLSGYWIMRFAIGESAASFYARRVVRLIPGLLALLGVWCLVAAFAAETTLGFAVTEPGGITSETPPTWLVPVVVLGGATNWWLAFQDAWPYALGHLWSLAVEWQFYAVAPLIAAGISLAAKKGGSRYWCLMALLIAAIICWGVNFYLTMSMGTVLGYLSSLGRVPALIAGMGVAVLLSGKFSSPPVTPAKGIIFPGVFASIAVVAFMVTRLDQTWYAIGLGLPIIAASAGFLVWWLASRDHAYAISNRKQGASVALAAMAWLGRRSYGAYLWNLPIVVAIGALLSERTGALGSTLFLAFVSLAVTIFFAQISWLIIEKPSLRANIDSSRSR